ncbi:MAG: competence/damage-inducible protein A [Acidobacteria bacterium]|nr:competence/damage-inducible protein A [Acidobacteriota bacterium]
MIAILVIGNELLSGQVQDTNVSHMLRRFGASGHKVGEVRIVSDGIHEIAQALTALSARHQWVISTGGLGPTHDDVTMAAYAEAFNQPLQTCEALVQIMRDYYGARLHDGHLRMARLPASVELIHTDHIHWPLIKVGNCFALPGLPEVFLLKFEALMSVLPAQPPLFYAAVDTSESESDFAAVLEDQQRLHKGVEIGSYPKGIGKGSFTRLTCKSTERSLLEACFESLSQLFKQRETLIGSESPKRFEPSS